MTFLKKQKKSCWAVSHWPVLEDFSFVQGIITATISGILAVEALQCKYYMKLCLTSQRGAIRECNGSQSCMCNVSQGAVGEDLRVFNFGLLFLPHTHVFCDAIISCLSIFLGEIKNPVIHTGKEPLSQLLSVRNEAVVWCVLVFMGMNKGSTMKQLLFPSLCNLGAIVPYVRKHSDDKSWDLYRAYVAFFASFQTLLGFCKNPSQIH